MTPCDEITAQIGHLYSCAPVDDYVKISTPFLYPDGDAIDVFFKDGEVATLSDLGSTIQWLSTQTLAEKRSPKQRQIIQEVCITHGIEFINGMLVLRVPKKEEIAWAVSRLTEAAVRVSDLSFTLRTTCAIGSVADEVAGWLKEKAIPFERDRPFTGYSGREWDIDFHTRTPRKSSLVYVLSAGNRSGARTIAEHVSALWNDLEQLKFGQESLSFVSLFDDTQDVWRAEDYRLVDRISDIAHWAEPDELASKLAA